MVMNMNKQDVFDYISEEIETHQKDNPFQRGYRAAMRCAYDRVKQLDEPGKVVVPQFVAEWIEDNREDLEEYVYSNVQIALSRIQDDNPMHSWLNGKGIGIFVDCIRNGYEVEKEKLYRVELPNPNGDSNMYGLCKVDGRIIIGTFVFGLNKASNAKLTEAEIKQDFDWAWQFAKEVKEND